MNILKSKILWVAVIIILGAVGAGFWKYLLEPSFFFLRDVILDILTLGLVSYKNAIYIEISKGFHEVASSQLLSLFLGVGTGFLIGLILVFYSDPTKKKASLSDMRRPKTLFVFFLFGLFFFTVLITSHLRLVYINNSVTQFRQLYAIVSPYVEDTEEEKYLSRFAQIQNKEDFFNLVSELKSIASNNNQTVPEFSIW